MSDQFPDLSRSPIILKRGGADWDCECLVAGRCAVWRDVVARLGRRCDDWWHHHPESKPIRTEQ